MAKPLSDIDKLVMRILAPLGVKTELDYMRFWPSLISRFTIPLLLSMQVAVYVRFYWWYGETFTLSCLGHFVVCLVLTVMIVWSHRTAQGDPGYLEVRHVDTFSDVDEHLTEHE